MNLSIGLVGLPNVGKSTLFNILTQSSIPAENYPFCTIDPHNAITYVKDLRMDILQKIYNSQEKIYSIVEFVDIAGLVKGASRGEGLGNRFLSHIRSVDVIVHVLRSFTHNDVINTQGSLDPLRDFNIIMLELALKDLESAEQRIIKVDTLYKKSSAAEKELLDKEKELLKNFINCINNDSITQACTYAADESIKHLSLLLSKPFFIVVNMEEDNYDDMQKNSYFKIIKDNFPMHYVVPFNAQLEKELSMMSQEERKEYSDMIGFSSHIETIIMSAYKTLNLISFFTCGPKEIHSWSITRGSIIKKAAGKIHSDLERGFISANVISYNDLALLGSELQVKNAGKVKNVSSTYVVEDGDIVTVHFNV